MSSSSMTLANKVSSGFRKIDVDQFNDDMFKEDESQELNSATSSLDIKEIQRLCSTGKHLEAIQSIFALSPQTSSDLIEKEQALNLIMQLFLSVKTGEIAKIVDMLDANQIDQLMKYIYKGFESPQEGSSAILLVWHDKVFQKGGHGSIVRVLTDNKKVK